MGDIQIPPLLYLTVNGEIQDLFTADLEEEASREPFCRRGGLTGVDTRDTNINFPRRPRGVATRP